MAAQLSSSFSPCAVVAANEVAVMIVVVFAAISPVNEGDVVDSVFVVCDLLLI